jgi:anthranilate synthase component 2
MTSRLLIIDNYDSFTWNIIQLVERSGMHDFMILKNDMLLDSDIGAIRKVIISPGPGIAREAGDLLPFLKIHFNRLSILGICLGHEAVAELFGARLVRLPEPLHGVRGKGIIIRRDPVFKGLPDRFDIGHYHSWILERHSLPGELMVTMEDPLGNIMAYRHRQYDLTGLQFHPESVMTQYGSEMIRNWLEDTR